MAAAGRRAGTVERGVVDLVEAALLAGREGDVFDAVVVDEGLVQLAEPAVRGRLTGHAPEPGSDVSVRLTLADVATRKVTFEVATPS
jgi:exoribonuclease R